MLYDTIEYHPSSKKLFQWSNREGYIININVIMVCQTSLVLHNVVRVSVRLL